MSSRPLRADDLGGHGDCALRTLRTSFIVRPLICIECTPAVGSWLTQGSSSSKLQRVARLYATTGDGLARLDESGGEWTVELFLESRAQCLAVDPADRTPSTPACARAASGGRPTAAGPGTTARCRIPASSRSP